MLKSLLFLLTYNSGNDNKNVETYNGGGSNDIGWWESSRVQPRVQNIFPVSSGVGADH